MHERDLHQLIEEVRSGALPRRHFIQHLVGLGLTAPMAAMLLMHEGIAQTPVSIPYKGTRRGGGGPLKLIFWQGAVHLNPHFVGGRKEQDATRIFYEPLAGWDSEGNLVPMLAAEVPSRANGGVSPDGRIVTWKLKKGVAWHDGRPFTADDVVFTAAYAGDPATSAVTVALYRDIKVEKVDSHTVRVLHAAPTPFWAATFTGGNGMVLPKHVFEPFIGAKSRESPANIRPVGTGPYEFVDFKPGDMLRGKAYLGYHVPNQPFFDTVEVKGGGDALGAARAVLQTGEFDFGWNLAVEDEILKRLETAAKGRLVFLPSGDVEFIALNASDPWNEVDGERASAKSKHPAFQDKAVRDAMTMLVDRKGVQEFIYGRGGVATSNLLNSPARYRSPNTRYEFNIEKANALLDAAGWKRGADGIRAKGTQKLKFVFQTSVNPPRQKVQAVVKDACSKAGIQLEIKGITAAVFFGGDAANPDTLHKFWADMQMSTNGVGGGGDPQGFMRQFTTERIPQKANKWSGTNVARWSNAEYDATFQASQVELDPVKRTALFIRMNDLVVGDAHVIPLITRPVVHGLANKLNAPLSQWDAPTWMLGFWSRES